MKLQNKIVPIGMLLIIAVSMINYPIWAIDYVNTKLSTSSVVVQSTSADEAETTIETAQVTTTTTTSTPATSLFQRIDAIIDKVQSVVLTIADDITFQEKYVELNTWVESVEGKSVFIDAEQTVVQLENGYLSYLYDEVDTTEYVENLIALNDYLNSVDTPLLYVQSPSKINEYDDQLPTGVTGGTNATINSLLAGIDGYVDYIDLREALYESDMDWYECFFKTDHHWLPETGFWAAGCIAEILNDNYGFAMDEMYFDLDNYNIEVYEDWFLGSQGKRVGQYLAGVDDISLITPKFETNIIFELPYQSIYRSGNFAETIFDYTKIDEKNYYEQSTYEVYMGGQYPLTTIENTMSTNEDKILMVIDSFGRTVAPFLALGCSQLDVIDLRKYTDESLIDYLAEHEGEYDLVIVQYSSINSGDTLFTFDQVVN